MSEQQEAQTVDTPQPLPPEVAPVAVTEPVTNADGLTREEAAERYPENAPLTANAAFPEGAFGTEPVLDRSIEEQIKDLEAQLDKLDAQRTKSAVEELVLEPTVLAAVAVQRAKERFPRAQKEVEKHIKALAYSGERIAYLEPSTPIFNNKLIQWLVGEGFSAKLIKIKETGAHKVEVTW